MESFESPRRGKGRDVRAGNTSFVGRFVHPDLHTLFNLQLLTSVLNSTCSMPLGFRWKSLLFSCSAEHLPLLSNRAVETCDDHAQMTTPARGTLVVFAFWSSTKARRIRDNLKYGY